MRLQNLTITDRELEHCVALAILDHNGEQNPKSLEVPLDRWRNAAAGLDPRVDDPQQVLLTFLPGDDRVLTPQGVAMFVLDYYEEWLGQLVPRRDRLGKLAVEFDPRDISRVYVRHPDTGEFRVVGRRDKVLAPLTRWQHEGERRQLRRQHARSAVEKVQRRLDRRREVHRRVEIV
jgi:putative transposase